MKIKKSELRKLVREEIKKLNESKFMKVKDLKPGMMVMHKEGDSRTSEPLEVVKRGKDLYLKSERYGLSDIDAGGESDYGGYEIK